MNWIKCTDRLPDDGVDVLVYDDVPGACWVAHINNRWWTSDHYSVPVSDNDITFWSPIERPNVGT